MNTALVVLCHRQEKYAKHIAEGIASQRVTPSKVLVVMDRPLLSERRKTEAAYSSVPGCEFLVYDSVPDRIARPPMNEDCTPFMAGHCRNLAIEMLSGTDIAIFIDGDCIPLPGLVESHIAAHVEGCVTVGRRTECKWGSSDQREIPDPRAIPIFGKEPGTVTAEKYVANSGVVWTCNFGITPGAVRRLKDINSALYGVETVFHPDFCGRWGGEDGFLGMECFYGGIPIRTTPIMDGDGVVHIEHPREDYGHSHRSFVGFLEAKREELVNLMNAAGMYGGKFTPLSELVGAK